jgi:hypothetical protein
VNRTLLVGGQYDEGGKMIKCHSRVAVLPHVNIIVSGWFWFKIKYESITNMLNIR